MTGFDLTTHARLWADWLGTLPDVLRWGVGVLVIVLVAVVLGAGLAVLDAIALYGWPRFSDPDDDRKYLTAAVKVGDRRRS